MIKSKLRDRRFGSKHEWWWWALLSPKMGNTLALLVLVVSRLTWIRTSDVGLKDGRTISVSTLLTGGSWCMDQVTLPCYVVSRSWWMEGGRGSSSERGTVPYAWVKAGVEMGDRIYRYGIKKSKSRWRNGVPAGFGLWRSPHQSIKNEYAHWCNDDILDLRSWR